MLVPRNGLDIRLLIVMLIATLLVSPSALALSNSDQAQISVDGADAAAKQAFVALQRADQSGANISTLVHQFNDALALLNGARHQIYDNPNNASMLALQANNTFKQLRSQAFAIEETTTMRAPMWRITIYTDVLITAAIAAIVAYFFAKLWRRFNIRRILEMEIEPEA